MPCPMKTASASVAPIGSDRRFAPRSGLRTLLLSSVALCLGMPGRADPLPTGEAVVSGQVSIARPGNQKMTITQDGARAAVNWQGFSIGEGAHVDIRQPGANAALLNRVTGDTRSEIHGRLTANGQVHLVNPNGILIGPRGTVNTGAFVASTLDISNEDFLAGRLRFRGNGQSATVENAGRVSIGRGGYAALLGGRVVNSGVVSVPLGRIGFGAGERVTLDLSGDSFLQVALPSGVDGEDALIEHSGLASAEGGRIEMRAATAREAVRHAVNLSGVAEARSVTQRSGSIVLGGGAGGAVSVSGRASTRQADPMTAVEQSLRPVQRPEITVTGQQITLAGAQIDASGTEDGGLIRIGGDFSGQGSLPRADYLTVDGGTEILADALGEGDGGRIAMWSDIETEFFGTARARGGDASGDGGFIEVSSKRDLTFRGLTDTRAANGALGMTLLDPTNITIEPGADETAIENSLENGSLGIDALTVGGTDVGDVTINATLDWENNSTLFIRAVNDLFLNGGLNAATGNVEMLAINGDVVLDAPVNAPLGAVMVEGGGTIRAGNGTGIDITATNLTFQGNRLLLGNFNTTWGITANSTVSVDVDSFDLRSGNWQTTSTASAFSADDFQIDQVSSSFQRTAGGNGTASDPFQIFDIYGVQGIGTYTGSFVLADNIDGSGSSGWNTFSGTGFEPIYNFNGALDGAGFTLSNLFQDIQSDGTGPVGMFNRITSDGSVDDLTIDNADFTGRSGGILATVNEGSVNAVRVSGSIFAEGFDTGGMVGANSGTIADSIAAVTIYTNSVGGTDNIGGFVGSNDGLIERSHATGPVFVNNTTQSATIAAGGFVGEESFTQIGTINDSYAIGDVTVTSEVGSEPVVFSGGFAGYLNGTINRSYSTGAIRIEGDITTFLGGFTGDTGTNAGGSGNFWDTQTSGQTTSVAATGLTTAQFQNTEGFILTGQDAGWNFFNTWAPGDTGFYPVNYSTSPVIMAQPDTEGGSFAVQYGQTPIATSPGSVFGGPEDFLFDEDGDTLNTTPVFQNLNYSAETVGSQSFTLSVESVTSANGVSYRVVDRPGEVDITPAPLTIDILDDEKTYGEALSSTGFTPVGLQFDDSVDSVSFVSDGFAADAPVAGSPYVVDATGAQGDGLDNYVLSFNTGALTVNPADLTITAVDGAKLYGEAFTPTEFTTDGLVLSDSVDSVALTSAGSVADSPVADSPYAIDPGAPEGTGLDNYDITLISGALTVNPAPLTITALDQLKIEGREFSFLGDEFLAGEFAVPGDTVTSVTLESEGADASALATSSPFAITVSDPVGVGIDNYDITFIDGRFVVAVSPDAIPRPPIVFDPMLPNPKDSITVDQTTLSGLAAALGTGDGGTAAAERALSEAQNISDRLVEASSACDQASDDVTQYLACLSDALNDFASELDEISSDLPPGMQNVARIIDTARAEIDQARTRAVQRLSTATTDAERDAIGRDAVAEAQSALGTASSEIRKAISLVRAEDPELAALQRATITTVADAVDTVGIQLTRSVGL